MKTPALLEILSPHRTSLLCGARGRARAAVVNPATRSTNLWTQLGAILLSWVLAASQAVAATTLDATLFGAVGDGTNDDGPAIVKMLATAAAASPPVTLQFSPQRTYYIKSATNRYAFYFNGAGSLTVDGGGSTFLLDPKVRFLSLNHSTNLTVRNCNIDFATLPFADGVVVASDATAGTFDVRVDPDQAMPPDGGATQADGEQAWFGLIWFPGQYSRAGYGGSYLARGNITISDCHQIASRVMRVNTAPNDWFYKNLALNHTRFSLPVPGVAHRFGPGECVQIYHSSGVMMENINVWSAPWFAYGVFGNEGAVSLTNVNVRPKPGTTRTATAGRDGFHVKCNRGPLSWDDCTVMGNGDDAFNIATHASTVRGILSPTRITISQNFPLGVAALVVGDTLEFYSKAQGKILGRARLASVDPANVNGGTAPVFTIDLDGPTDGLVAGDTLCWDEQSSNPHTTLRNCRLDTSSRLRSPVTLDHCQFNALAWFTGDEIEAPVPSRILVENCQFRLGQGNPDKVIVMEGPRFDRGPSQPVISGVTFNQNTIFGDVVISDVINLTLVKNHFIDPRRKVTMNQVQNVHLNGNQLGLNLLESVAPIQGDRDPAQFNFSP